MLSQGFQGDFVAVDLGYAGCQPWPEALLLTSPISACGMPTDFSSDLSGAAIQPAVDSADWMNLITVQNYKPQLPSSFWCISNPFNRCGVLTHNFPIQPKSALGTIRAPTAVNLLDQNPSFAVSVDINTDQLLFLDVEKWFHQHSQACCLNISALIPTEDGLVQLPPWLSLLWQLTMEPVGVGLTAQLLA